MADNLNVNEMQYDNDGDEPSGARRLVADEEEHYNVEDTRIVWFGFMLGNWKALVTTTVPDGRYYEVTYHKAKSEIYVDTYQKIRQTVYSVV